MYTQSLHSFLWAYSKRIYANIYVQSRFQLAGNRIMQVISDVFQNKLISKWFTFSSHVYFYTCYQDSMNERSNKLKQKSFASSWPSIRTCYAAKALNMLGNDRVLLNHVTSRIVLNFLGYQSVVPDTLFTWQFAVFKINVKYDLNSK